MSLDFLIPSRRFWAPLILCAITIFSVHVPASAQSVQQVAAIVNDDVISTFDLDQRVRLVLTSSGVQPTPEIIDRVRKQVLRSLVDERLELHEADKNKITVSEDEITKSIKDISDRNNLPPNAIKEMLEKAGVDEHTLREQIRAETAWNKLVSQKYGGRIFVSDEEIDAELKRLTESFNETQYLVSEIVLNVNDPKDEEDVKRTAQRLLEQMQKGGSFTAIAQQFSQAPSAAQGGDLGWLLPEDLDPDVAKHVVDMLPGQVTSPLRTSAGYQIIALRSKRKGSDGEPGQIISVSLKQVLAPVSRERPPAEVEAAKRKVEAIRGQIKGCDNVESVAASAGLISSDLGKIAFDKIAPFFRSTVSSLSPGEISEPVESPAGVHLVIMCDRQQTEGKKATPPTRQQVEDRLWGEQISVMSRRYLRDLHRDSVVEYR